MERESVALFTWGYWGWGAATGQFINAVGAVEEARGFKPPMFVDIRVRRSVRAPGFNGPAFERTVGPALHRWMPLLGNLSVLDGSGGIRIKDPTAAADLLDLALECHLQRRRILFFCSCEYPGHEGVDGCHRTVVARLVLEEAQRRHIGVHVHEWPGGEPSHDLRIDVPSDAVTRMERGARSIRLREAALSFSVVAGIPWYSDVEIVPEHDETLARHVLTGPAKYRKHDGWCLPIMAGTTDSHETLTELRRRALELRLRHGFDVRSV